MITGYQSWRSSSCSARWAAACERIGEHGPIETHIVLSTQYEARSIVQTDDDRPVTSPAGWTRP